MVSYYALQRDPEFHPAVPSQRVDTFSQGPQRWKPDLSYWHHPQRNCLGAFGRDNLRNRCGIWTCKVAVPGESVIAVSRCQPGHPCGCDCPSACDLAWKCDSLQGCDLCVDCFFSAAGEYYCGRARGAHRLI